MLTKVKTATLSGVKGYPVTVETDVHSGLPGFHIVGLADTTIKEASRRIKPAIQNCGGRFPGERVTVNLVPAGRPKEGSHFGLPIALGIMMMGSEVIELEHTAFIGEVSLDGTINGVRGALPLAICLRQAGIRNLVLPAENAAEASILEDITILPVSHLTDAAEYVLGLRDLPVYKRKESAAAPPAEVPDFAQVIGQESVKRAILVGAAGNHGILMMGSPGCGKTMMARRIPGILPELTYEEKVEITGIYSVAGLLSAEEPVIDHRPFRSPHHNITQTGLLGGGARPRPGELSLAHRGALITAELAAEQGREVFAVPGNIDSQYNLGNNKLIREGAAPLISTEDILEYLGLAGADEEDARRRLSDREFAIFEILKNEGELSVDEVCMKTGLTPAYVNPILAVMEMKGFISSEMGRFFLKIIPCK